MINFPQYLPVYCQSNTGKKRYANREMRTGKLKQKIKRDKHHNSNKKLTPYSVNIKSFVL